MKILNKYFPYILFSLTLNCIIIILLFILNIPSLIVLNPVVIVFGIIEFIFLNIFSLILFNQYLKYKRKIFGEILKFKITTYLLGNIISIFFVIVLVFSLINYSPSINKIYDDFNYKIEEDYLSILDKINTYKDDIKKLMDYDKKTIQSKLINDPLTLYLQMDGKNLINKINLEEYINLMNKEIIEINFVELYNKGYIILKNQSIELIYLIPENLIQDKKIFFDLILNYKKIYSQQKNSFLIIFLALFIIIIPILFFQVFFLFKYISKITQPLELLVVHFKKVSSNIYSQIPLPKKRFDEFSFLIMQFNRMQKQLEQRTLLLKYQERFEILAKVSSKFAHEIKNPLTPIILACELIDKKYPYQDNFKSYLTSKIKVIQENVEYIRNSINKFYSISSKTDNEFVIISMNQFLKSLLTFWNSEWIDIRLEIPDQEISLRAQKEEIESLFNNLIINSYEAVKFEENQICKIFIKLNIEEDRYFYILYTDSGSGINIEDSNKIFEPYFTTKKHGSGFGLAITRTIVENIKGTIEFIGNGASNLEEYKGATFLIKFPLNDDNV